MPLGNHKFARRSVGFFDGEPYENQQPWTKNTATQCGGDGMVFTQGTLKGALTDPQQTVDALTGKTEHYRTAYFEAFIESPSTFIRGEGSTIEEAEANAYAQYEKIRDCEEHLFQKRGYENGLGTCKHCKLCTHVFVPTGEWSQNA